MSDLVIICEGPTEQLFCNKILKSHLAANGVNIKTPLIAHSNGGIVGWNFLKPDILTHHASDNSQFITTFIDYYGMYTYHNFPDWTTAAVEANRPRRMEILEAAMKTDLPAAMQARFIPYVQLHEFEALVLVDPAAFSVRFNPARYNVAGLQALCANPPESVNDGVTTAPSKQIKQLVRSYNKVVDGAEIPALVGLANIRARCPRFDQWVTNLEAL